MNRGVNFATSLSFSTDGKYLFICGGSFHPQILDLENGGIAEIMKEACRTSNYVLLSPNSSCLLSDSYSETYIWQFPDGKPVLRTGPGRRFSALLAVSPDSQYAAFANGDGSATVFSIVEPDEFIPVPVHGQVVSSIAFSSDSSFVAVSALFASTEIWTVPGGRFVSSVPNGANLLLSFCQNGRYLVTAQNGDGPAIWNVQSGALVSRPLESALAAAISQDGKYIAASDCEFENGYGKFPVKIFRIPEVEPTSECSGTTDAVRAMSFTADGRFLVTGGDDSAVEVWRVSDGALFTTLQYHYGAIRKVACSPNGRYIASADDNSVIVWEPNA